MKLSFVVTSDAPKAIGPYSQAVTAGDFIFTAGQIALDPATKEISAEGIVEQTEQVLSNLEPVLLSAGLTSPAWLRRRSSSNHGRLRRNERGLCTEVWVAPAGAQHRGGGGTAAQCSGGD